jgi:hypothetical protein
VEILSPSGAFPVFPADDVASLLSRTHDFQLVLFYEIIGKILQGEELPISTEKWEREPFPRKEFNELCKITPEMDNAQIKRRIRATNRVVQKPQFLNNFPEKIENLPPSAANSAGLGREPEGS